MKMSTDQEELETEVEDGGEIITLFGIEGGVGNQFVKLALSAGYYVHALSPIPIDLEHEFLTVVEGDCTSVDDDVLEDLLRDSTYVVCLLSDSIVKKDYPEGLLFNFVQKLYPMMKESPVQLFVYQATATTADTRGKSPVFANVVKYIRRNAYLKDQDKITQFIGENSCDWFKYIVTRPGLTREGPSKKRLAASKSVCFFSFLYGRTLLYTLLLLYQKE